MSKKIVYTEFIGRQLLEIVELVENIYKEAREYFTSPPTPTPNDTSTPMSTPIAPPPMPTEATTPPQQPPTPPAIRDKKKDILFYFSCIGFMVFAVWVGINKDSFNVPYVRYADGTEISGNCDFVKEEYMNMKTRDSRGLVCPTPDCKGIDYLTAEMVKNLNNGVPVQNITVETIDLVTTLKPVATSTLPPMTCPVTTTTQPLTCPACECPYESGLSKAVTRQSLNVRPDSTNSPAYSAGCFDCLKKNWEIIGIPVCDGSNDNYCRPKFNQAPSTGYYKSVISTNKEDLFCFPDEGGYFTILRYSYVFNNTDNRNFTRGRWGWNDQQCLSSKLEVRHL